MRHFLLTLLLLAPSAAIAQVSPAAARPDSLPAAQAVPDTAAAIHRLFAARRLRRNLIAAGLGTSVLAGAIISDASQDGGGHSSGNSFAGGLSFSAADYLIVYAVPGVPLILLDYTVYANYSRKREAWVVEEFRAHRLPSKIRRKLKPRYFR